MNLQCGEADPEKYMKIALEEAQKAFDKGEVPVGCIIVREGQVIARAHNLIETNKNATCHAEILAIHQGSLVLNNWRLIDCTLFVTIEPCPMCLGAILNSRISRVVFGASEPRTGALGSVVNLTAYIDTARKFEYEGGILKEECKDLLQSFFMMRRKGDPQL